VDSLVYRFGGSRYRSCADSFAAYKYVPVLYFGALGTGNPAKLIHKRFDDELIRLLAAFKWWDKPIDEIQTLIPLLSDSDLERARRELKERLL